MSKPLILSDEQYAQFLELLKSGEREIPADLFTQLFDREKAECELTYRGKMREEDIIADTLAVPLQPMRTYGDSGRTDGTWHNKLILGNNLQVMKTLLEEKRRGKLLSADGSSGVKLVYIDPPFATKQEFKGNQGQIAYRDKVAGSEFLEFIRRRLILIRELLSDDGSIFLHLDTRKIHAVKILMDEIFGEDRFQNEIIWQRTDPHNNATTRLGKVHDTILWFSKAEKPNYYYKEVVEKLSVAATKEYSLLRLDDGSVVKWTPESSGKGRRFKLDDITYPNPNPERQFEWRGARPSGKRSWPVDSPAAMDKLLEDGIIYLRDPNKGALRCKVSYFERREDEGQVLQDIWLNVGRMKGGSSYPTEKPEALLERIIKATTKEGDLVLDAFAGSGTTCVVAEKLSRRWVAIDCGKLSMYTIQRRLLSVTDAIGKNKGKVTASKPFTLYHAGLYDFSKLKELPWSAWRSFALQLFQCRDEQHTINGMEFDGYLRSGSTIVYNHIKGNGAQITRESIEDLHRLVGTRVGDKVFIIAPALCFGYQGDYITLDNVRYYALRVPYSIVEELYNQEFTSLRQPIRLDDVNDIVDSIGFDFIKTPLVKYTNKLTRPKVGDTTTLKIKITNFESDARIRAPQNKRGRFETLAMVIFDFNFNESSGIFNFDQVFYAESLMSSDWEISVTNKKLGAKIMMVLVDIYGNEARELIDTRDL